MKRRAEITCDDCFFRRHALCAMPRETPCPTFRTAVAGGLAPPRQPPLVARPLERVAVGRAA